MRKANPELWLLLFLVIIAAGLNFLVASQPMVLMFYFLPTLYSAYRFGRRHATLTAVASVVLVVLLTDLNPRMFIRQSALPIDARWFDLTVWGGILVVCGYAMGALHERNLEGLQELKDGYDGMLVILQQFLSNQKCGESSAFRISVWATQIAESLGLDKGSIEDLRIAALLQNLNEVGISNDVLYKAANLSQEDVEKGMRKRGKATAQSMGGSLQRAIPILVAAQQLIKSGTTTVDAAVEAQILVMAENYDLLTHGPGKTISPAEAEEAIMKNAGERYDSMILDAFAKAFGHQTQAVTA
jgi:hypothetical protein